MWLRLGANLHCVNSQERVSVQHSTSTGTHVFQVKLVQVPVPSGKAADIALEGPVIPKHVSPAKIVTTRNKRNFQNGSTHFTPKESKNELNNILQ